MLMKHALTYVTLASEHVVINEGLYENFTVWLMFCD